MRELQYSEHILGYLNCPRKGETMKNKLNDVSSEKVSK